MKKGRDVTKFKKFNILFLLIIVSLSIFSSSCSQKDGSNYLFKYALSQDPKNLDPQLAVDTSSLTVIQNMFEGLLKISNSGTLSEGVATRFDVSDNGLVYNFTLRQNAYWTGNDDFSENVTADDFVFAFKRIVDPKTYSPYAEKFYCIKNAEKINKGELDVNKLGITAKGKYAITIELDYPNADFLRLLTTPPAMPCNEKFFYETKGKYGLESDAIICNGPFYLTQWLFDPYGKDNYLILRKNMFYNEISRVYPAGLNYFIIRDEEKIVKDFKSGDLDCIINSGENKDLFSSKNKINEYQNKSSGLVFNLNNSIFKNSEVRKALSISIDRSNLSSKSKLPSSVAVAGGLIPPSITILNKSYRITSYNVCYTKLLRIQLKAELNNQLL